MNGLQIEKSRQVKEREQTHKHVSLIWRKYDSHLLQEWLLEVRCDYSVHVTTQFLLSLKKNKPPRVDSSEGEGAEK